MNTPTHSIVHRQTIRPLGTLSNYVVEQLPSDLRQPSSDLSKKSETLAMHVTENTFRISNEHRIKVLDCTMLESAIRTRGEIPGPMLTELTDRLAAISQDIPSLNYESLIDANPLVEDPRTFLCGEDGDAEIFFYRSHARIEHILAECTIRIRGILESAYHQPAPLSKSPTSIVHGEITPMIHTINRILKQMLKELPIDAFARMRPYFGINTIRGFNGPSGKYSAGVFAIDALLYGNDPMMQAFLQKKMSELNYFPGTTAQQHHFCGRQDMQNSFSSAQKGETLFTFQNHTIEDLEFSDVLRTLFQEMHTFRTQHFAVAQKFVPDALKSGTGTGGEGNLRQYLQQARDIYEHAMMQQDLIILQHCHAPLGI